MKIARFTLGDGHMRFDPDLILHNIVSYALGG